MDYFVRPFRGKMPKIADSAYIYENVSIYGDVTIGENTVVMPNCVIRGEFHKVVIGNNVNIQDLTCIHGGQDDEDVIIGDGVSIGHGAVIHGCTIEKETMIGMGAIVQNGAHVGLHCLIGAGAVVGPRKVIADGMMALGVPAKEKRPITEAELNDIKVTPDEYLTLAKEYLK